jgi:hypothetical protein
VPANRNTHPSQMHKYPSEKTSICPFFHSIVSISAIFDWERIEQMTNMYGEEKRERERERERDKEKESVTSLNK